MSEQNVKIPFVKGKVPVVVDIKNHAAIQAITQWGPELKRKIEEACFASYRDKVDMCGPDAFPRIRKPNEVWKHLELQQVRIDPNVKDTLVIYVVPAWDESEHMEWCIRGTDQLVYVGQFVAYPVDGYQRASDNFATQPASRKPNR